MNNSSKLYTITGAPRTGKTAALVKRIQEVIASGVDHRKILILAGGQGSADHIRTLAGLPEDTPSSNLIVPIRRWQKKYGHAAITIMDREYQQQIIDSVGGDFLSQEKEQALRFIRFWPMFGYKPEEIETTENIRCLLRAYDEICQKEQICDLESLLLSAVCDSDLLPLCPSMEIPEYIFDDGSEWSFPVHHALINRWSKRIPTYWTWCTWPRNFANGLMPLEPHSRCSIQEPISNEDLGDVPTTVNQSFSLGVQDSWEESPFSYEDVGVLPTTVDRFFSLGLETFWNLIEIYNNKASSNFEGRIQSAQFENEMQEISYLIATMNEKHEHGIKWNEMAILVRHLSLSSDLLNAISRSGIPLRQPSRGSTFSWDDIDGFNNHWRQPIDSNEDDSIDAVTVVPARYSNGRSWPVLYIPQCDVHHWPIPLPDQIQMNDNQRAFFLEEEHKLFLRSTIRAEKQIVFTWSQYEKGDIQ